MIKEKEKHQPKCKMHVIYRYNPVQLVYLMFSKSFVETANPLFFPKDCFLMSAYK